MNEPTIEEIRRAAEKESGCEPLYTQRAWRAMVQVLLRTIDEQKRG